MKKTQKKSKEYKKWTFLLTTWPKKRTLPKHYKWGGGGFSIPKKQKQVTVTKRPFLDKKTKPKITVIIFGFFLLFQQQKHKNVLKHLLL